MAASRLYPIAAESVLVGLAVRVVYVRGAAPTICVGDSGELVAAVATLGIPDPSGYPLYVLLGKLWTLLVPLASIAYRMSLFSAVTTASAVAALHAVVRSGLGFGHSPEFHARIAHLLETAGESLAARGHRLRMLELRDR